jgi:integrase
LSPDDIDREQMIVHVDRQLAYVGNKPLFELPKGRKTRIVPVSRGLLEVIDDYMEANPPVTVTLPWGRTIGDPASVRLLIVNDTCGVDTGSDFNWRYWRPAFARAGLTYVEGDDGMHALRHFTPRLCWCGVSRLKSWQTTSATQTPASRCGHTHICCPPAMKKHGKRSTASSNHGVRATWSPLVGRPDDGPAGYRHVVIAGQRSGSEEARLLVT